MSQKEINFYYTPVVLTRKNAQLVDYLRIKNLEKSSDDLFDEFFISLNKHFDDLPNVHKRILLNLKEIYTEKEYKEMLKEAFIRLVNTKGRVPEKIVKEWNLEFKTDAGVVAVLMIVAAIVTIVVGVTQLVIWCHQIYIQYGSSKPVPTDMSTCYDPVEEINEQEVEYAVEYACWDYYDEDGNYLGTQCDEPEPPDDIEIDGDTEIIKWGEPIIVQYN